MRGAQADQYVDVVLSSIDRERNAIGGFDCASEICVEAFFPIWFDERKTILRAEHDVVMETGVSRWHQLFPRPFRAHFIIAFIPGTKSLATFRWPFGPNTILRDGRFSL